MSGGPVLVNSWPDTALICAGANISAIHAAAMNRILRMLSSLQETVVFYIAAAPEASYSGQLRGTWSLSCLSRSVSMSRSSRSNLRSVYP